MEQTLLLNATYEPLKVVHWQKAITLLCQGKVEIVSTYDREVRSVSVTFRLPSVIRLLRYIRIKRRIANELGKRIEQHIEPFLMRVAANSEDVGPRKPERFDLEVREANSVVDNGSSIAKVPAEPVLGLVERVPRTSSDGVGRHEQVAEGTTKQWRPGVDVGRIHC